MNLEEENILEIEYEIFVIDFSGIIYKCKSVIIMNIII